MLYLSIQCYHLIVYTFTHVTSLPLRRSNSCLPQNEIVSSVIHHQQITVHLFQLSTTYHCQINGYIHHTVSKALLDLMAILWFFRLNPLKFCLSAKQSHADLLTFTFAKYGGQIFVNADMLIFFNNNSTWHINSNKLTCNAPLKTMEDKTLTFK